MKSCFHCRSMKVNSYKDLPFSFIRFKQNLEMKARPQQSESRVLMKMLTRDLDYEGLDVSWQIFSATIMFQFLV